MDAVKQARGGRYDGFVANTELSAQAGKARDLRAALLLTSRELLDEGGPAALRREVARRAGCTHQAPYHYFANREAILAAVVAEGFSELADRLEAANDHVMTAGLRGTAVASSNAYVGFAIMNPGVFQVMFRPDMIDHARYPDVQEHGTRARESLRRLVQILYGDDASPEMEIVMWAQVHGLASLLISGPLGYEIPTQAARLAYADNVNNMSAERFKA